MKELLPVDVPEKAPPIVAPGNSLTTGGMRSRLRVVSTRRAMVTFGSTRTVCLAVLSLMIFVRYDVSTVLSFEAYVLFVQPR